MSKFLISVMAGLFLIGCQKPVEPQAITPQHAVTPTAKVSDPQPMSLGFSPAQFQERFNANSAKRNMEFRINSTQLKPLSDVADQWIYQFTNNVGFLVTVNRHDGTIRSFTYMASGDGTPKSGIDMMFALNLIIRTVDPALSDDTANQLMLDLMDVVKTQVDVARTRNGIHYGATVMPKVGLFVAINPS